MCVHTECVWQLQAEAQPAAAATHCGLNVSDTSEPLKLIILKYLPSVHESLTVRVVSRSGGDRRQTLAVVLVQPPKDTTECDFLHSRSPAASLDGRKLNSLDSWSRERLVSHVDLQELRHRCLLLKRCFSNMLL